MSVFQEKIEALGGCDAASADERGFIVCTDENGVGRIMASVVLNEVFVKNLSKFYRSLIQCVALRPDDVAFGILPHRSKKPCIITFETPERDFVPLFKTFVLYLGQAQLLTNPIICCKFNHRH